MLIWCCRSCHPWGSTGANYHGALNHYPAVYQKYCSIKLRFICLKAKMSQRANVLLSWKTKIAHGMITNRTEYSAHCNFFAVNFYWNCSISPQSPMFVMKWQSKTVCPSKVCLFFVFVCASFPAQWHRISWTQNSWFGRYSTFRYYSKTLYNSHFGKWGSDWVLQVS